MFQNLEQQGMLSLYYIDWNNIELFRNLNGELVIKEDSLTRKNLNLTQRAFIKDARFFIYSLDQGGKTAAATVALLESLAAKQYTVAEQGGRYVVSASVQGKSFTYELPQGQTADDFSELCYDAWRYIDGMTDAQLEAYIKDADNECTNVTQATFAINAQPNYGY